MKMLITLFTVSLMLFSFAISAANKLNSVSIQKSKDHTQSIIKLDPLRTPDDNDTGKGDK